MFWTPSNSLIHKQVRRDRIAAAWVCVNVTVTGHAICICAMFGHRLAVLWMRNEKNAGNLHGIHLYDLICEIDPNHVQNGWKMTEAWYAEFEFEKFSQQWCHLASRGKGMWWSIMLCRHSRWKNFQIDRSVAQNGHFWVYRENVLVTQLINFVSLTRFRVEKSTINENANNAVLILINGHQRVQNWKCSPFTSNEKTVERHQTKTEFYKWIRKLIRT